MRHLFLRSDKGVGLCEVLVLFLLFAFGTFVFYGYCQEERVTLTTYYPSPFGIFRNMNITRVLNMSEASAATPNVGVYFQGPAGGSFIRGFAVVNATAGGSLRVEVPTGALDFVYIGGAGLGNGLTVWSNGNVTIDGNLHVKGNLTWGGPPGHECIIMTYSSFSGITTCPPGYTIDVVRTPAVTGVGGIMYCCN